MPDKFEEVAADLDDLATNVEELQDEPEGIDTTKLDKVKEAIDTAKDAIDDIAEDTV
jgi:hypothetical protein